MGTARAAIWLLTMGAVLAAEAPPVAPPPAPPADDSIVAAKRDLEAIKAARVTPDAARDGLPRFSAPEFSVAAPGISRTTTPKTPAEAAALKKSENWLVDAMTKRPTRPNDTKQRLSETTALGEGQIRSDESAPVDQALRNSRTSGRAELREPTDAVANPLANFMAGWMTQKDYKLLQSTWIHDGGSASGIRNEFPAASPSPSIESTADRLPLGKASGETASRIPRENPFLTALGSSGPASGNPVAATVASAPPAKAPSVIAPAPPAAPPAPANPARPAFVKPADDAKYFKPLKKF
jgi:hypothetical protein